jgi:PTH2 family peptidyl-tRNA hydrolase
MIAKQVIVMRNDLRNKSGDKLRKGKLISQGCHASMGALLSLMEKVGNSEGEEIGRMLRYKNNAVKEWLMGKFTKICVYVESEEALLDLHKKALEVNIPCALIEDAGLTEFDKPTNTCLGLGPAWDTELDVITGNLPLF